MTNPPPFPWMSLLWSVLISLILSFLISWIIYQFGASLPWWLILIIFIVLIFCIQWLFTWKNKAKLEKQISATNTFEQPIVQ